MAEHDSWLPGTARAGETILGGTDVTMLMFETVRLAFVIDVLEWSQ